jgi:hypothetical protein
MCLHVSDKERRLVLLNEKNGKTSSGILVDNDQAGMKFLD